MKGLKAKSHFFYNNVQYSVTFVLLLYKTNKNPPQNKTKKTSVTFVSVAILEFISISDFFFLKDV